MKKILIMSILTMLMSLVGCGVQKSGYESVMPDRFEKIIADKDVVRLDVRTPEEYAEGHIAMALNIDVKTADFAEKAAGSLPKGKTIAVYCRSGRRSKMAADILVGQGFNVVDLDNGYLGWVEAGKQVEK